MLSKSFINYTFIMVRQSCDTCQGSGKIVHPLIEAYQSSHFQCWHDFFVSSGMDANNRSYPTRDNIDCPECGGKGYTEKMINLSSLIDHCLATDEGLERTIRQVIRKVQQEEQDRKDLADFMEPDDYLDNTLPEKVFGPTSEGMKDLADFLDPEDDESITTRLKEIHDLDQ